MLADDLKAYPVKANVKWAWGTSPSLLVHLWPEGRSDVMGLCTETRGISGKSCTNLPNNPENYTAIRS